jgi:hypothetical protein
MDLVQTIQQIDEDVPLIVEVGKTIHIELLKKAMIRFQSAGIAAVQIEYRVPDGCLRSFYADMSASTASESSFLCRIRVAVKNAPASILTFSSSQEPICAGVVLARNVLPEPSNFSSKLAALAQMRSTLLLIATCPFPRLRS